MNKQLTGTQIAERLLTRPSGATMREIIEATGGPQYNKLKQLKSRGYAVRKVREGEETRYFVEPPMDPAFEATVTSKGQVTIPKEVRDRLRLRAGQKVRFVLDADGGVSLRPEKLRLHELFGILGKPPRSVTIEEMDEAVRRAAVDRYYRAVGKRR